MSVFSFYTVSLPPFSERHFGSVRGDVLQGRGGNDQFFGNGGDDALSGGGGTDIAEYVGVRTGYRIERHGSTWTITDIDTTDGDDGSDSLTDIEVARFADTTFDLVNHVPLVSGTGATAVINATVAAANLINVGDADSDSPTIYRFWDNAGGGFFRLNGVTQAAGQNIDVTADAIGTLVYVGSANVGAENLWAQVYDGVAWSEWVRWSQSTVRAANALSTVSVPNRDLANDQWIRASELGLTVIDADGDVPAQYRFTDGNSAAGSARLWFGGDYVAQGGTVTIDAGRLANLWIQGGAGNGIDGFSAEVNDGYGWSNVASFNLVTRTPNRAPVATGAGVPVTTGATVAATSLVIISDADGDAPTIYRFWDLAGGGHFRLNGTDMAAGRNIDVAANVIDTLVYVGGANAGTENLWAQVYDGAAWSEWVRFGQQTVRASNSFATVSAQSRNLPNDHWIRASELGLTVTDADGDAPAQYRFTDGNGDAGSARLWFGGDYVTQGGTVTVDAARLANLWIQGGSGNGTDGFSVQVNDGYGWGNTASFSVVTRAPNRAPAVAGTGTTVTIGNSVAAASLITVTDADGDNPTIYRFWDNAGGGFFRLNGITQAAGQNIDVPVADIAGLVYVGGANAGSENLWAQVHDGVAWGEWVRWSQQTIRTSNALSTLSVANRNLANDHWIRASELGLTVTDADGDAPAQYRFTDGNGDAGSARLWFGGDYVTQGGTVTVDAARLANLWIQGGSGNGTDGFSVQVNDGYGWSNAASFDVVTQVPNRAPVLAGAGGSLHLGDTPDAATLFSGSDANGDSITRYRFWDNTAGGGYLSLNGVRQAAQTTIEITADQLAQLVYIAGDDPTLADSIEVRAFDGADWGAWIKLDTRAYIPVPNLEEFGTQGSDNFDARNMAVSYGRAGPDSYAVRSGIDVAMLVGGEGPDGYWITSAAADSIIFIMDSSPGDGTSYSYSDHLNLPDFLTPISRSGIAYVDGTALALTLNSVMVILPYWDNPSVGGLDYISNGLNLWSRASFTTLLSQIDSSIPRLSWEDIGFNSAEIRQKLVQVYSANQNIERIVQQRDLPDLLDATRSAAAPLTGYSYVTLSQSSDSVFALTDNNVYLARQGDDQLGYSYVARSNAVVVGGAGADRYTSDGNLRLTILEDGDSTGDRLTLSVENLGTSAVIVDDRHLLIRNFRSASGPDGVGTTLILDWQAPANRIESFVVNTFQNWDYASSNLWNSSQTYSFDQFNSLIDSYALPHVTWEQLGAGTAGWNTFIAEARAKASAAANNHAPVIVPLNVNLDTQTRSPITALFRTSDPDGDDVLRYRLFALQSNALWTDDGQAVTQPLDLSPSELSSYRLSGGGVEGNPPLLISAFDGYDWSPWTAVPSNINAPVITSANSVRY